MNPLATQEAFETAEALQAGEGWESVAGPAARVRDRAWGNVVTYSPKVFIPLTMLCRDVCHYCTFAKPPRHGQRAYLSVDEVLEIAAAGAVAGCREALFTLGDKPERRYRAPREELAAMGFSTTLQYLRHAAARTLAATGLLPHHGSPDKEPAVRLGTIEEAGRQRIPFTTGLLIGIGETWKERAQTLLAIRDLHERYGHIQEVIVQNFRAKPGTLMAAHPEPAAMETAAAISLARLILPPEISVQAPPNLAAGDDELALYLQAGINDWGGVSPVTADHVNPEAPWPPVSRLRAVTEAAGFLLVPRLTVYPRYAFDNSWVDPKVRPSVLAAADAEGLSRGDRWRAGRSIDPPDIVARGFFWSGSPQAAMRPVFRNVLDGALAGRELNEDEITLLFSARGPEQAALFSAADALRKRISGEPVTFVVNRNINYTNMCYYRCGFCAFSKGPKSLNLRGDPYLLDFEEIARRTVEAAQKGATEVCLQGGIHPSFTGDFYVQVLRTIKRAVPDIHVHAFSPLEVWQGAETKGSTLRDFLWELKDNGLSTLPGTAAEVLDDEIRAVICPDKINTAQWRIVAETAHALGLKMTTTIMFGHVDGYRSWARHLLVLKEIQKQTGGFTEFVPLPFVHMATPIYLRGRARQGPTFEEAMKMHAVSRLALDPWITNIQASWVKLGTKGAQMALKLGANDLGGTLMNEIISRSAGADHGQEVTAEEMKLLAAQIGRPWSRRDTLYRILEAPDARSDMPTNPAVEHCTSI